MSASGTSTTNVRPRQLRAEVSHGQRLGKKAEPKKTRLGCHPARPPLVLVGEDLGEARNQAIPSGEAPLQRELPEGELGIRQRPIY